MSKAQRIIDNYGGTGLLYLSGCDLKGITLPTSVGGSLYLRGCENVLNAVHNCGNQKRTISVYTNQDKQLVVSLGCFVGTEIECHNAIDKKYSSNAAKEYKGKVSEAFKLYYESQNY